MPEVLQQTLAGGHQLLSAIEELRDGKPKTMLRCEECEEWILRSRRFEHPHDLVDHTTVAEQQQTEQAEAKVPEHARLATRTYEVTFHYEYRETIRVEATSKADAKTQAEHQQTYEGHYVDTIHTEQRALDDEDSAVSIEYLENNGLLPDDHDVTEADLRRVMGVDDAE